MRHRRILREAWGGRFTTNTLSMQPNTVIGVDLGTQSTKAVGVRTDGRIIAQRTRACHI